MKLAGEFQDGGLSIPWAIGLPSRKHALREDETPASVVALLAQAE